MIGWKTAVVAVVAGVGFHALNDFRPSDTYVPAWSIDRNAVDGEFSESYYQARALFRERAKQAHATLHTLPLNHLAHLDLTIDVAVIPGTDGHVFLHMSGTHGVEGFTGSAIQSRILRDAANLTTANGPTVVLIHAVNPYGFSQLRRVNEHNVDLNRNWLSPEQFADATAADPNQNGYDDIYDIINPQPVGGVVQMNIKFWFSTLVKIAVKGLGNVKASMVAATYHHTTGLFFGGQERQPSLVLLEQFLKHVIKIGSVKSLTVLDVHTGLGPSGVDTLVITPVCAPGVAESVFGEENAAGFVASTKDSGNAVMAGYAATRGYVTDGIASLAPAELHDKLVTVAQEFGTLPMIFVKKALIEENAFYHHAPTRRLPFAEKLRDVFYVHQSPSWRQSIMHRGITVFQKLYKHHENSI